MATVIYKPRDTRWGDIGVGLGQGLEAFAKGAVSAKVAEDQRNFLLETLQKKLDQQKALKYMDRETQQLLMDKGYKIDVDKMKLRHMQRIEELTKEYKGDIEKAKLIADMETTRMMMGIKEKLKANKELAGIDFVNKQKLTRQAQEFKASEARKERAFKGVENELDRQTQLEIAKEKRKLAEKLAKVKQVDKRQLEFNKQFTDFIVRRKEMPEEEIRATLRMFEETARAQGLKMPNFNVEDPFGGEARVTVEPIKPESGNIGYDEDGIYWME